ncbi:MAG: hypothetical protein B7C54_08705 [Acidimicrobiales bacterium mtb01]|nr:hypothetical protein [Actinomycetota bacterium]TEX45187.1 MAG: hypothetical protein B7C54_08705 [Acidimicrobiales bacterium mtb01]
MKHDDSNDPIDASTRRRLAEIVAQLESIGASLDEISFDILREASERRSGRPDVDRVITQARRAIEKAARLLEAD